MRINSVLISNFKSIKEAEVNFKTLDGKSNTIFLVGINESGKSAILEALSYIKTGLDSIDYEEFCYKPSFDSNFYIDLYTRLEIENKEYWVKQLIEKCNFPKELANKIKFKLIEKNVYLRETEYDEHYNIEIANIDLFEYIAIETVNSNGTKNFEVHLIKTINKISEKITKENASTFYQENQLELTIDKIEAIIAEKLANSFDLTFPKIQIWKPEPEYLINTEIDLNFFKSNTNLSIPLRNIFHIANIVKDEDIKTTIDRALAKQEKADELKDSLSESITKHINSIWKEHKIKLIVSINGSNCQVFVQDLDKKHKYYKMSQRSDGFKQFISLILSLSAQNESKKLTNNLILIDEPEVHLHPSGVQFMRDELLKIGMKNYVFVSTHSHYLVDTSCPERHWIVRKDKGETFITYIDENTPLEDDKVLSAAFGLNFFKELLPKVIIVVEGKEDKNVFLHSLDIILGQFFYTVKSAGGASKMPGIASLLADEKVPAYFIFDDDKDGVDNKNKILSSFKDSFSNKSVFTIRDIENGLPPKSTLEDLYPLDYVKTFFDSELNKSFKLDVNLPFIGQLKVQDAILSEKQKLESLKIKLSEKFISENKTSEDIKKNAPKLFAFISKLIEIIKL